MTGQNKSIAPTIAKSDDWGWLKRYTEARIALGHAGVGVPTAPHLAFQAAHAEARDAVHKPLDAAAVLAQLAARGWASIGVASRAADRATYLQRPDEGRLLDDDSVARLSEPHPAGTIVLVVADGLSSRAVQDNAVPVLDALVPRLIADGHKIAPVVVATQGRVALADHVGELLQADIAIMLIGERPGLSAADSLGLYITHTPRRGRVDAERNCISNVRPGGQSPAEAARQAAELVARMVRHKVSGVALGQIGVEQGERGAISG